jgi:translation initiation factor 1 (eIF-1/SUI1)
MSNVTITGIDLKVAAKFFGQRFACGSSVTGEDEIVIQGDVKGKFESSPTLLSLIALVSRQMSSST